MRTILFLIGFGFAGCTAPRPISVLPSPNLSMEAHSVIDSVRAHVPPNSMQISAVLSLKTPLYSGTLNAEVSHRRADSLMMIFRVPGLGFEGGKLLVTPDSFFFYNRLTQTLHIGESNHPALPALFTVENAIGNLLGFVRPVHRSNMKMIPTKDGLVLTDSVARKIYTISPEIWRVTHVAHQDHSEALYMDEFFPVDGTHFPRKVIYRNSDMNTNAILIYKSITVNESITSMSLDLPSGTERMPLSLE